MLLQDNCGLRFAFIQRNIAVRDIKNTGKFANIRLTITSSTLLKYLRKITVSRVRISNTEFANHTWCYLNDRPSAS